MAERRKRFRWLRYVFGGLLVLFLLVLIFYQQIIFGITQLVAQQVAKSQAFSLQFKIHGSIISSLYIEDLHLQPLPGNTKLPLERVDAGRIALRYSLLSLFKKDFLNLLELVELKDVDAIVRPSTEPPPPPQKNPNGLRMPVVLPKKIDIQNVNLTVRSKDGDLEVKKFALEFQQGSQGYLGCETLRIPSVGAWKQVHANLSYNRNKLAVTDLALEPLLNVRNLQIDLSGSEQGKFILSLDAKALGSSIAANALYLQPAEKPSVDLALDAIGLDLGHVQKLAPIPISGSIPKIEVRFKGELDRPDSFSGSIALAANGVRFESYAVDTANLSVVVDNGKGEIRELSVNSGANKVRATGTFRLADSLNDLAIRSSANIGLAAAVSEPERYVPGLMAASLVTGSMALSDGRAQVVVYEAVKNLSMPRLLPGFSVPGGDSNLFAVTTLPIASDIWPSIAAIMLSDASNISYQDARIEGVELNAEMRDGKVATVTGNLISGGSRAEISTTVPLPPPQTAFDVNQVAGRLNFKIGAISDFIRQNQIEGVLTANGDLRFDHLQINGTVRANGKQLKYRGMILQGLGLETFFSEGQAQVQEFRIAFDPDNYLHLTGLAKLTDPFPFQAQGELHFKDVAVLNELLKNLGAEPGVSGALNVNFSGSGDIQSPSANLQVSGNQLQYRGLIVQEIDIRATAEKAKATIQNFRIALDPKNKIELKGTAQLADPYPYAIDGTIGLTDLAAFNGLIRSLGQPGELTGALNCSLSSKGDAQHPGARIQVSGDQFKYRGLLIPTIDIKAVVENAKAELQTCRITVNQYDFIDITGEVGIGAPFAYQANGEVKLGDLGAFNDFIKNAGQPADLKGSLNLDITGSGDIQHPAAELRVSGNGIKYRGLPIQNVDIDAKLKNQMATIDVGRIDLDINNFVDFTAEAGLNDPYHYKTIGSIEFNDLGVFKDLLLGIEQSTAASGNLHANWSFSGDARKTIPDGNVRVAGDQIKYRGLLIQNVDISGNLLERELDLPSCKITFNKDNFIDAKGSALLEDPYNYNANAMIRFQDLGFLNELSKSFGQDLGLAGKLSASLKGKGPLKEQTGNLEMHGEGIQTKTIQKIKFDTTINYQGLNAEVPRLEIFSPYADLDTSIRFSPKLLEIPTLNIRRSGNTITGNAKIPLDLQAGKKVPLDLDQPVDINIQGNKIALNSFQSDKPQVTGTVGFQVQASQTLRDPVIQFTASAKDLRATSVSSLSAANADFTVRIANKELSITGKVQQPDIRPLELAGKMPLDVGQIIQSGSIPEDTPLRFDLKWPDSKLAFLRKVVPDIKIIEGTAGAEISVNGTIKHPDLAGSVRAALSRFQAKTDTVPPIADFSTNISFQHDHVRIDRLKGLAGGGAFGVTGTIDLTDGTNPKFDIGATGKQVLLTRSDGIIVRSDLNLAIRGPLSSGEVSGTVGITQSRFFKDIDILPLNLPGRPPPPPPAGAMPKIAVETPPFKDWKFNILIRTDDPFLIQSNLARGRISINLQAGGTGAAPSVTGLVRIDRLVASLPFSRMEIDGGRVDFVQGGNILDPTLSIVGRSTVSNYDVRARIFGHVSNPTVLLDSSPPLAQGDILVLLATGSTTSEYAQNPSLLAGRATFIVVQQIFRKFFPSTNRADGQKEPFIDRFSVNIVPGSKAGEQNIVSSFKLTKNWQIIGDFGTSSYQGRLKYLIRFR